MSLQTLRAGGPPLCSRWRPGAVPAPRSSSLAPASTPGPCPFPPLGLPPPPGVSLHLAGPPLPATHAGATWPTPQQPVSAAQHTKKEGVSSFNIGSKGKLAPLPGVGRLPEALLASSLSLGPLRHSCTHGPAATSCFCHPRVRQAGLRPDQEAGSGEPPQTPQTQRTPER